MDVSSVLCEKILSSKIFFGRPLIMNSTFLDHTYSKRSDENDSDDDFATFYSNVSQILTDHDYCLQDPRKRRGHDGENENYSISGPCTSNNHDVETHRDPGPSSKNSSKGIVLPERVLCQSVDDAASLPSSNYSPTLELDARVKIPGTSVSLGLSAAPICNKEDQKRNLPGERACENGYWAAVNPDMDGLISRNDSSHCTPPEAKRRKCESGTSEEGVMVSAESTPLSFSVHSSKCDSNEEVRVSKETKSGSREDSTRKKEIHAPSQCVGNVTDERKRRKSENDEQTSRDQRNGNKSDGRDTADEELRESKTGKRRVRTLSELGYREKNFPIFDRSLSDIWTFDGFAPIKGLRHFPGISNFGTTCFVNSVMQCLAHLPPFTRYIVEKHKHLKGYSKDPCLSCALRKDFFENAFRRASALNVLWMVKGFWRYLYGRMYTFQQEDAHEFLITLISKLDNEFCAQFKGGARTGSTPFEQIFFGKIRKEIECSCGFFKTRYQKFLDLNLALPTQSNGRNSVTTTDLLTHFVKKQKVEHKCEKCGKNMSHTSLIYRCPSVLVLQILCFNNFGSKIYKQIDVEHFISLRPFTYSNEGGDSYELMGIVSHDGNLNNGHYTAMVRGFDKKFHFFDDDYVTDVKPFSQKRGFMPYLMIYSRKGPMNFNYSIGMKSPTKNNSATSTGRINTLTLNKDSPDKNHKSPIKTNLIPASTRTPVRPPPHEVKSAPAPLFVRNDTTHSSALDPSSKNYPAASMVSPSLKRPKTCSSSPDTALAPSSTIKLSNSFANAIKGSTPLKSTEKNCTEPAVDSSCSAEVVGNAVTCVDITSESAPCSTIAVSEPSSNGSFLKAATSGFEVPTPINVLIGNQKSDSIVRSAQECVETPQLMPNSRNVRSSFAADVVLSADIDKPGVVRDHASKSSPLKQIDAPMQSSSPTITIVSTLSTGPYQTLSSAKDTVIENSLKNRTAVVANGDGEIINGVERQNGCSAPKFSNKHNGVSNQTEGPCSTRQKPILELLPKRSWTGSSTKYFHSHNADSKTLANGVKSCGNGIFTIDVSDDERDAGVEFLGSTL
ncbi:hypothetical protein GCK32_000076 [Trichostrongylus colubriformis]|uniref:Ubiquitin carboxyl-terminal hydrolase 36 n=1 Tax=Trichostrongylus colubriformis TaxID=6319 RepID=A0AAN8FZ00_TRICO